MTFCVRLDAQPLPRGELPTAFRIFQRGWNETSKGRFLFDEKAADSVLRDYKDQGNELCLDYDHKALDPDARAGDGKASGWFELELRDEGLWAVNVRWTPPAEEALRNGEWRYVSPAFVADAKTKRILSLLNVALTNLPATKRMEPLVAASAVPFAACPIVTDKWDAPSAITRLRHWASTNGNKHKDVIDWERFAQGFAWVDDTKRDAFAGYKLPHHDVRSGRLVTSRNAVRAAGATLANGRAKIPDEDLEAVRAHLAGHYHQMNLTPPWEENAVMAKKESAKKKPSEDEEDDTSEEEEMDEEASEDEAMSAAEEDDGDESDEDSEEDASDDEDSEDEPSGDEDDDAEEESDEDDEDEPPKAKKKASRLSVVAIAQELTGKRKASEIVGVLRAHKHAREQVTLLSERLHKLERALHGGKVRQLVSRAVHEGKLTPALRPWALNLGRQDLTQLRAYLDQAAPLVPMNTPVRPADGGTVVTLSANEKTVCALLGVAPELFANNKARRASFGDT